MKDRVQDELKQKYPEPEMEKEQNNSEEEGGFLIGLAWGALILLVIALVDHFLF